MRSNFAPLLANCSEYLEKHNFVEVRRNTSKWGEEALFQSPAFVLKIGAARDDVGVEAKPNNCDEDWYDVQTVLEMLTGATPQLLDAGAITSLLAQMESAHDLLVKYFATEGRERVSKYALWTEGSYWGNVLKMRAARDASKSLSPWWKFW